MGSNRRPIWYHGSPRKLSVLKRGSTITQDRRLAEAFSHKPTLVSVSDDGSIKHDGVLPGFLYRLCEDVRSEDVVPHPRSAMAPGKEWLTNRELRLCLVGRTLSTPEERLTKRQIARLRRELDRPGSANGTQ